MRPYTHNCPKAAAGTDLTAAVNLRRPNPPILDLHDPRCVIPGEDGLMQARQYGEPASCVVAQESHHDLSVVWVEAGDRLVSQ
jgi:hypothetical protein